MCVCVCVCACVCVCVFVCVLIDRDFNSRFSTSIVIVKPILNWANVCSLNMLRTLR